MVGSHRKTTAFPRALNEKKQGVSLQKHPLFLEEKQNSQPVVLAVSLLQQLSQVLVFPPRRFKVEELILDTYSQIIQRFL